MKKVKAHPADLKLKLTGKDVAQCQNGRAATYATAQEAEVVIAQVFEENAELFRKLAR